MHPLPWPIEDALPEPGSVIPLGPELVDDAESEPEMPIEPNDELFAELALTSEPDPEPELVVETEPGPEPDPDLEDGFAVLRELLATDDAAPDGDPEDEDDDGWVTAEEHAAQVAEVARLNAELETAQESLTAEWQRGEDLRAELDETIEICDQWEAQAVALRAELDELEAENRSLRIEIEALHQTVDGWEGEERRGCGPDTRTEFELLSQGERRRGLAPRAGGRRRPLSARADDDGEPDRWAEPAPAAGRWAFDDAGEPEPSTHDEHEHEHEDHEDETVTSHELVTRDWSGRLRQVGEATAAWSNDDMERLRGE